MRSGLPPDATDEKMLVWELGDAGEGVDGSEISLISQILHKQQACYRVTGTAYKLGGKHVNRLSRV